MTATEIPAERRVTLADGTTVSDGDAIITRRNNRRLTLSATDWVANGDRWTVTSVRPDGAVEVRHAQSRRRIALPADYVAQHVQLGYACTVHAAQGQTVDTSHTVLTGSESRQLLYVGLTRGRHANTVYLDVSVSGDGDDVLHADAIRPPTAIEVLTRVVEHDDSAVSASSARGEECDPVPLLRKACAEYIDALGVAAESVLGPEGLAHIEARADAVPDIIDCPAWPALNTHLQRLVLDGIDADQVLRDEAMLVRRDRTRDLAAILAARLDARQRDTGPLPWLPPVPRQLDEDDFWGRYFDRRAEHIQRHATAVRAATTRWTVDAAPVWAVATLANPDLTRDLAVWRAARGIPDTEPRPSGPPAGDVLGSRVQQGLDRHAADGGAPPLRVEPSVVRLAESIDPGITADPHWAALARQLEAAHGVAIDLTELRAIATARPLPIEQPAAALAYRLINAIGDRQTPAADEPSKPTGRRRYEPPPIPTAPPEPTRTAGLAPVSRPGPRR